MNIFCDYSAACIYGVTLPIPCGKTHNFSIHDILKKALEHAESIIITPSSPPPPHHSPPPSPYYSENHSQVPAYTPTSRRLPHHISLLRGLEGGK